MKKEKENRGDGSLSEVVENEVASRKKSGSLLMILRYSDWKDMVLMMLGTICCFADGISMAAIMVVLSQLMDGYAVTTLSLQDVNEYALRLLYVAISVGSGAFLEGFCWARTAERQTSEIRKKYLRAVLRQDHGRIYPLAKGQSWLRPQDVSIFDKRHGASSTSWVVSSISVDILTIEGVLSEKIPNFIMNITMFITAQIAAGYLCWRLAVVTIPALSILIIPGMVYGKILNGIGEKIQEAYDVAGGIAEQALSSIETVYSYIGENQTLKSYSAALESSLKLGIKQGLVKGLAIGSIGASFAIWAFQAWHGSILVIEKRVRGGNILTAGVCIIYGGLALGGSLINVKYFVEATIVASSIFEMIEQVPSIDSYDEQGEIMNDVKGELEFKDVHFAYPSRPDSMVLQKFNLKVMAGQTVGLVGSSGSGKSTVISLVERFYDPLSGEIHLDEILIKTLKLKWLRSQMGLVSQEPLLFATSIRENIMFGKEDALMEEVISAAKAANAHDFISQLPNGYDTQVGQLGSGISGGQKQRIAIARALIKDPRILLLDEATSSLDSQSENAVQDALDHASVGRTTIIVAHRFSTLRNANLIAFIQSGEVVECGPHDQLIQNKHGPYSAMVQLQQTFIENGPLAPKETDCDNYDTPKANTIVATQKLVSDETSNPDRKTKHQEDQCSLPSVRHLMRITAPEWKQILIACISALCYGVVQPVCSFCMGAVLSVYSFSDHDELRSHIKGYCFIFLACSIVAVIANAIQHYNFGIMGECLTKRVREAMLAKILTFEMRWFDQENNGSGAICSRLATDANMVRTLVADRLSFLTQSISIAFIAVILGLALAWRLAILVIAMQPFIIAAFYGKAVMMRRSMSKKVLKAQNKSSELASETVGSHRTIASIAAFSSQEKVMQLFEETLLGPKSESQKQSWYAGLGLFMSQFLTAGNTGLLFWYGGRLLFHGKISFMHLFQTFFILVTAGRVIGETGSMTADLSKGTNALKTVFMILKRKSKMDPDGIKPESINGNVEFKEVTFAYAGRPEQMILMNLCLKVEAGKTVALVGQSGSGKSTIIRLIERFYDPLKGSIEIDGIDIKFYNLRSLRSHMALVSQESTLFAGTIHENILYGKESATEAEILEAATLANAHEFISFMKDGYATYCGERGVQLSGGQKQRIALARAILKNPTILLLDKATSALDSRSENLVQDAMEKMMLGRTCIVVAHRLSSIQKSDSITVVDHNRIVEEGSHREKVGK